jgi:transcription elongation factor/antiterminator RfaH
LFKVVAIMKLGGLGPGERWYAVRTLPGREMRARAQLENQEFRTFLPRGLKTVRHARKFATVTAAFFPQYLFVMLDLARHRWRSINGTLGVASLVMQGDLPHPVPHGVVETLVDLTDARGLLQFGQELQIGDRVRVTAGPFAEKFAICARLDDSDRARVLLDIMGGQIAVSIGRDYLRAAE